MRSSLRLSVSKAKTFGTCKRQFKFNYIEKLPQKDQEYTLLGKLCHGVLEKFHLEYISGSDRPFNKALSDAFKASVKEYNGKITDGMKKEAKDMLGEYLMQLSRRSEQANILACEKPFSLVIEDDANDATITLNGVIDRIQVDKDGIIHVIDYKTTKNKKYLEDDWFQLLVYAYVLYKESPDIKKVRASYVLLRHNFEYLTDEFNVKDILDVEPKILEYASSIIKEKEYKPTTSGLCKFCSYIEFCDEGKEHAYGKSYGETSW